MVAKQKFLITVILLLTWSLPVSGLVFKGGNTVVIEPDETIDDDLIVFAQTIKIQGRVNGDVIASGREVRIENEITGTLFTGGAEIDVAASSLKSLWAFCGQLKFSGNIERNLLFFGGKLGIDEKSRIGKDLRVFGGEIDVNGNVNGAIKGNMGKLLVNSRVGKVNVSADMSKFGPNAEVLGDVNIKGKNYGKEN